ncbi:MAG TPA: HDIG domain-containing protein [Ignavibacteria bacterium]|nr:HDIG domain-containing protein [Ignavibacteria bacterium]
MPRAKENNFQDYFKKLKVSQPEKNIYVKILIAVVTIVIISLMLPSYKNIDANIEVGTIWSSEDLIAPFSFPIYKDEADLESEKKEVYDRIIPVFIEVTGSGPRLRDTLSSYFRKFNALISLMSKQDKQVKKPEGYKNLKDELNLNLTDEQWSYLVRFSKGEVKPEGGIKFSDFEILIQKGIVESLRYPIINYDKAKIVSQKIAVKRNDDKTQKIEALERYSTLGEAKKTFNIGLASSIKDNDLMIIAEAISDNFIKETLFYDKELTELEIKNRIEQIPKTVGIVRENERIISKHDPITKLTKLKLDSFKKIRLERLGVQDFFAQALGKILTVIMLIIILGFYLFHLRRDVFERNSRMALISSLMILVSFFAFMSLNLKVNAPVELLIFVPVASILLTILFDSRLSFFVVVIITFLVAAIRGGDYTIAFISLSGSILAIFSVRDIKNRSQIFRSFFFVIAGYSVAIIAVGLDRSENLSKIAVNLSYAAVNAIMSPVIAYGLLIFYEKVFRITTDLTLIELADFNQPLLRELSAKAPGTFHHSVVMGNLSEEAAASIGANRVLARVGSYYHDIGKAVKPDFFVENQLEKKNKHEGMNPTLSAKVIIAHVKEGIELARRYRLPQEVIDFIPMHHGTTLVSFFYNKAKNLTDENKEDVLDYIYRYPGPKPQNKETAIVMLADTVEASTKAIEDPTPKKLEDKIDEIIKKRFIEGELDDCNLTLKDLTRIKKSFLKILIGIYHQRIKYPEEKAENE